VFLVGQLVLVTLGTGAGAMALGIFVAATAARPVHRLVVVLRKFPTDLPDLRRCTAL
jgi:hypothetical protein